MAMAIRTYISETYLLVVISVVTHATKLAPLLYTPARVTSVDRLSNEYIGAVRRNRLLPRAKFKNPIGQGDVTGRGRWEGRLVCVVCVCPDPSPCGTNRMAMAWVGRGVS